MCWNEEISFMTALMSTTIAIYIKNRNNKDDNWTGNFLLAIAGMQYIEFIAWLIINNKKDYKTLNIFLALIAVPFVLALQPIISYMGAYNNGYLPKYYGYFYMIYGIVVFLFLFMNRTGNEITVVQNNKKTLFNEGYYLDWGHIKIHPLLSIFHTFVIIFPFLTQYKKLFVKLMLISGFFTKYIFAESASRWCLYTNIWSIIFLFNTKFNFS